MNVKDKLVNSIETVHQRHFVLFGVIAGHSNAVIQGNLAKLIGNKAISLSQVAKYASEFRKGEVNEERARGGSKADEDLTANRIEIIKSCFQESRAWSLRSLASRTGIPKSTCARLVKEKLTMRKVLGKWIPHELTVAQQEIRALMCQLNLATYRKTQTLLRRTITIDETWVSLYMQPDRNQARQYLFPGEQPEKVPRENIHGAKRMLIMAMDFDGIAFWELMPAKSTVDSAAYKSFLEKHISQWLGERSSRYLWLLHDNARVHKARVVTDYLEEKGITLWKHPPYSPDISPLDFCCFGQLKRKLRGVHHENWEEFEARLVEVIEELNSQGRMKGVQELPERWQRVIDSEGEYL